MQAFPVNKTIFQRWKLTSSKDNKVANLKYRNKKWQYWTIDVIILASLEWKRYKVVRTTKAEENIRLEILYIIIVKKEHEW